MTDVTDLPQQIEALGEKLAEARCASINRRFIGARNRRGDLTLDRHALRGGAWVADWPSGLWGKHVWSIRCQP